MFKRSKKVFAGVLSAVMLMTAVPISQIAANAQEVRENNYLGTARKSQYVLYSSSKDNGIQLNGNKYIINGNVHSNSNLYAYLNTADVRGKLETVGKVVNYNNGVKQYIKKENAPQRVLIDPKEAIMTSLGATPTTHDNWQTYSGTDVTNAGPIYAKSGLQFCGTNISLKDTIVCENSILISASNAFNSAENGEVNLYSTNGNISIYTNKTVLNGVIYAPNGTVQITGSDITINGMIIAKEIQISADKVTLNQNLKLSLAKSINYYNEALQVYADAEYKKETNTINLNWQSTFEKGKFDIYSSTDGINFAPVTTVNDVATYAYPTNGATNDIYFRVKETLDNGFTKDSNDVKMVYNTTKGEYELIDADTDGEQLIDSDEFFLETDKTKVDTDGDGLSDYAELNFTNTDPLYVDSDENGVLDCDEDPDGDTLTNLKEIELGTNPQSIDTDEDTLADNGELYKYQTSPIKADTDEDTINDGDEYKLGLNPLSKDSDGDGILDGDEKIEQKIDYTEKKPDSKIQSINLEINAAGYAPETTTIENVKDIDTYSSDVVGIIGDPFRIETTSEFETAKLTFKVDKSQLGSTNFNDLKMMWYNESTGFYEYFNDNDTIRDETNGTITTTTTHFCTILVVDGKIFENSFAEDLYSKYTETKTTKYNFNTLIAIDTSFNLDNNDNYTVKDYNPDGGSGYNEYKHVCERQKIVDKYLKDYNEHGDKSKHKIAIAPFHFDFESTYEFDDGKVYNASFSSNYPYNKYLDTFFRSDMIENEWGTEYPRAINQMIKFMNDNDKTKTVDNTTNKTINTILFISDGAGTISDAYLNELSSKGVIINTVAVPGAEGINTLKRIAKATGGTCYTSANEVSLTQSMSDETSSNLDVTTNSDNDTIPDLFEKAGMKCTNGRTIYTKIDKSDSDGDNIMDSDEVKMVKTYQYPQPYTKCQYLFTMVSDPNEKDTDGDTIEDNIDKEKLKKNTIETMYKLSKKNKPTNPIYIEIKDNTIYITANVYFYEYEKSNQHLYGSQESCIDLAIKGIEGMWTKSFSGSSYDFLPGIKGNVVTKVNYIKQPQSPDMFKDQKYLTIKIYSEPLKGACNYDDGLSWNLTQRATISMYSKDSRGTQSKKDVEGYPKTAAHEFGHALGLHDLYPSANDLPKEEYIDCLSGEISKDFIMWSKLIVSPNDIEMVLQAFAENKEQYYYNVNTLKQSSKQSKAIKSKFYLENQDGDVFYEN